MKVETQELPDSQVVLSFEIEDARVARAIDAAYRRAASRVDIAGFRRGRAPRPLVERVVGRESLVQEALNDLLPEAYAEAAREANVRALTEPEFDVESLNPLRAKATVVVEPPVRLGDYRAIHRDLPTASVTQTEIDSVLEELRDRHAEWVPVERPTEMGDRVTIDVVGTSNGRRVITQLEVSYVLEPEGTAPLPGFAQQLVGAAAGETRSFDLPVPADYRDPKLAGQTIAFQVTVGDAKAKELPELDDAFAATVGSYSDLGDLRSHVEGQIRQRAEAAARRALEEEILEEAVLFCTVQIPQKLIDQQVRRLRDRLARDLDSQGLTLEQYLRARRTAEDELNARIGSEAERQLKRTFVLQKIAAEESIEVGDEEVDAGIREALGREETNERDVHRALQQRELRERVRASLLEQRTARWLVEHATGGGELPRSNGGPLQIEGEDQ